MFEAIILFIFGLVLLIRGGDRFVDSACGIAHRFNMPEILIGATIVSIGTTLPEVMVSAQAAAWGQGGIAYGNAIGSIICNTALIAAIIIALRPPAIERKTFTLPVIFFFVAAAVYLIAAYVFDYFSLTIGIILLVIFVVYMVLTVVSAVRAGKKEKLLLAQESPLLPTEAQVQAAQSEDGEKKEGALTLIGDAFVLVGAVAYFAMSFFEKLALASAIVALVASVAYIAFTVANSVTSSRHKSTEQTPGQTATEPPTEQFASTGTEQAPIQSTRTGTPQAPGQAATEPPTGQSTHTSTSQAARIKDRLELVKSIVFLVIGAAIIALGARLLVDNGTLIAKAIGVPESVIGLTFVAIGTSLPELVTAITSLIKKHGSLSLGNIIGANLFNLVLVSGVSIVISPFAVPTEQLIGGVPSSLVLELPVMLFVMMFLTLPAIIRGKLARWQGIAMLCIYVAFFAVQFAL